MYQSMPPTISGFSPAKRTHGSAGLNGSTGYRVVALPVVSPPSFARRNRPQISAARAGSMGAGSMVPVQ